MDEFTRITADNIENLPHRSVSDTSSHENVIAEKLRIEALKLPLYISAAPVCCKFSSLRSWCSDFKRSESRFFRCRWDNMVKKLFSPNKQIFYHVLNWWRCLLENWTPAAGNTVASFSHPLQGPVIGRRLGWPCNCLFPKKLETQEASGRYRSCSFWWLIGRWSRGH